jgi:hypothetical protein
VRRGTVTAAIATVLLTATGCLTPLTPQRPLTPVSAPASPLVGGVTLASIAAGGSDSYLRSYADAVVALGHPVILSFGHEVNGTWR